MQIIIPMSGTGKRFRQAGFSKPKPLIEVEGKPIIEHVINLFPGEENFIFICNEEHLKTTNMREILLTLKPKAKIISLKPHKFGPVYATLKIQKLIKDEEPIMMSYCDYSMVWDYLGFKEKIAEINPEGAVPCYTHFHPHLLNNPLYAGVRVDKDHFMLEIKEKHRFTQDPMQTLHSPGMFYFKNGKILKKYFKELSLMNEKKINGEHYISSVYELLLRDSLKVYVPLHPFFMQWGTPEDLKEYEWWSQLFKYIASGLIAEETIKFKKREGRRTFEYWKQCFNQVPWHPYNF